jgi:arylsulfatase A-like enzyme/uncharacterized membrane protein
MASDLRKFVRSNQKDVPSADGPLSVTLRFELSSGPSDGDDAWKKTMNKWALTFLIALLAANSHAQDADSDGVADSADNCVNVANADQRDSNADLFGNACDADLNNDCTVDAADLVLIQGALGSNSQSPHWDPHADLNGDGRVDSDDQEILQSGMSAAPGPGVHECRAPNILFYILDDVGIEPMPQYGDAGSPKAVTPTMSQLAADGVVFENVWVNPMCAPTRSTLVTGSYVIHNGFGSGATPRALPQQTSLQTFMASNTPDDYATGAFGKWHVNDNPNELGVEYYAGLLGNIGRENSYYKEWTLTENGVQSVSTDYPTTLTTHMALDWLEQQDGGPWFAWIAHQSPHGPFHTPPEGMYSTGVDKAESSTLEQYLAMLESVDFELDRILDSLDPAERAYTTIIVLGDNGSPGNAVPGSAGRMKGSVYQGGIEVPMIVSGYRVARAGEREDALVNGTDMFATIAELAGTGTKAYRNSISQLDLFSRDLPGPRKYAYSEDGVATDGTETGAVAASGMGAGMGGAMGGGMGMGMGATDGGESISWTVRNDNYKLISANGTEELYDLTADPREGNNLLDADSDDPDVAAALAELRTIGNRIRESEDTDLRR